MIPTKEYKITPIYLTPGDTISVHYSYQDDSGVQREEHLTVDTVDTGQMVDTILAFKLAPGEYGLRAGRALVLGEDSGGRLNMPTTSGYTKLIGNRRTKCITNN
jgi:hypothetical protein